MREPRLLPGVRPGMGLVLAFLCGAPASAAEVTDVANAVYEEVDAVMLSGETTVGKHPIRCVEQLDSIARVSEKVPGLNFTSRTGFVV